MNKKILCVGLALLCTKAFAGTVVCGGVVESIAMHSHDSFMVKLSSMNKPVFVCSTASTWSIAGTSYTTSPETCKSLISVFLTSKSTNTPIATMYFDGADVPATCDGWGDWKNANIRFFSY